MKEDIIVAFSGGRTSAYMSKWLIDNMSHLYNLHFVYANTGLEHEKTLEFVDKCDKYFELNLVWIEAKINKQRGKGTEYEIVDYSTATRGNKLFMDMAEVYGLPNGTFIHCTRELKIIPMNKYGNNLLGKKHRKALGIRHDEFRRVKNDPSIIYPLATITKTTKQEILKWWSKMPFDLEIEEHYGNCVTCYKKSDKKLKMIADENPDYFNDFIEMENKYKIVKSKQEGDERVMFRGYRTAHEVKHNLKLPDNLVDIDECAEECGSVLSDYESPSLEDMIYQKGLFD